jgi:hypothetical protein
VKKFSTFLAIKDMKIKVYLQFHLTPIRWAIIKNTNYKFWLTCGEKRASYTVGGNVN